MTDLRISLPHTSYPPAEPAPDHAANEPSRTQSFLQGAILGDYNEHPTTSSFLGQVATGFIPGVGQLTDLRDTIKAGEDVLAEKPGAWASLGLTVVAWVPGVGDTAKAAVKQPALLKQMVEKSVHVLKNLATSGKKLLEEGLSRAPSFGKWFYKPGVKFVDDLSGAYGGANRYGDIFIQRGLPDHITLSTFHHEKLHSVLSPKFLLAREWRASQAERLYEERPFLKYTEEALAETYAQVRTYGLSVEAIRKGVSFPFNGAYGLSPKEVVGEAALLAGGTTAAVVGGYELGRSAQISEAEPRDKNVFAAQDLKKDP